MANPATCQTCGVDNKHLTDLLDIQAALDGMTIERELFKEVLLAIGSTDVGQAFISDNVSTVVRSELVGRGVLR